MHSIFIYALNTGAPQHTGQMLTTIEQVTQQ